jgi:DNA-binding XRE family transcriptional regulator
MMLMEKRGDKTDWRKKLKEIRERLGLTQEAAAAKVGVSKHTWICWENHQRNPSSTARILIEQLSDGKL